MIAFSHIHIFKHEGMRYKPGSLNYTRVGLCDPNNNSLSFLHCPLLGTPHTCFYIMKNSNLPIVEDPCSAVDVPSKEIEDHQYMLDQPLLFEKSRDNQALISKTDNLTPNFLDNLLKYLTYRRHSTFVFPGKSINNRRFIPINRRFSDNIDNFPDTSRLMNRFPHRFRDFSNKS